MTIQDLQKGGERVQLHLSSGSIVAFKSALFNADGLASPQSSYLDLYNEKGDIILRIRFRTGESKIFCTDYISETVLDGWGEERSFDLDVNQLLSQRWGATISVYNFLTDSRLTRYQILVNLTTVCYFDSRAPGPVTQIGYWEYKGTSNPILSDPLKVMCCAMLDLPPEEQRAIQAGM